MAEKVSLIMMGVLLGSCTSSVSDFVDPFTDDVRVDCDIVAKQTDILMEMSRVAELHEFTFTTAEGTVQDGEFITSMADGPAQIFVTNYSFEGITIIATFAVFSEPDADQRQNLKTVVDDLVSAFNNIC